MPGGEVEVLTGDAWLTSDWDGIDRRARQLAGALPRGRTVMVVGETSMEVLVAIKAAWCAGSPLTVVPVRRSGQGCRPVGPLDQPVRTLDVALALVKDLHRDALDDLRRLGVEVIDLGADHPVGCSAPETPIPLPDGSGVLAYQSTSGTTGAPRYIEITGEMVLANLAAVVEALDLHDERVVSWLPLFHDMGLLGLFSLAARFRWPLAIMANGAFARDPLRWLQAVDHFSASLTAAAPIGLSLVLQRRHLLPASIDLSTLEHLVCGADRLDAETLDTFMATLAPNHLRAGSLVTAYGMAEATLAVALGRPSNGGQIRRGVHAAGRPLPILDLELEPEVETPDDGERAGLVRLRGPSVAATYLDVGGRHRLVDDDGWLLTGDLAERVGDEIWIHGRTADRIVIDGGNIDPAWLEGELLSAFRSEVGEIGVGGRASGSRTRLTVHVRVASTPGSDDLGRRVRSTVFELTGCPAEVHVSTSALPRTSSGKLQRRHLSRPPTTGGDAH